MSAPTVLHYRDVLCVLTEAIEENELDLSWYLTMHVSSFIHECSSRMIAYSSFIQLS